MDWLTSIPVLYGVTFDTAARQEVLGKQAKRGQQIASEADSMKVPWEKTHSQTKNDKIKRPVCLKNKIGRAHV